MLTQQNIDLMSTIRAKDNEIALLKEYLKKLKALDAFKEEEELIANKIFKDAGI